MMSDSWECIKLAITSVLPSIAEETLSQLINKIIQQGVESSEDLQYVREEDIAEFIRPIQCRKLLDAWKLQETKKIATPLYQSSVCSTPLQSSSRSSSPLPQCSTPLQSSSRSSSPSSSSSYSLPSFKGNWAEAFQVAWEKMPPGIRTATTNGKRPSPSDRRQMVRVLVDDMRKYEANPARAQCLIIAKKIVNQFPQSFADILSDGHVIGEGFSSLLSQIKVRVEHLNRNNTLARLRSAKDNTGEKTNTGPADSYGCTRWQPDLPSEETESTLNEKKLKLLEFFSHEGLSAVERAEVQQLMETTYYLQRKMINTVPAHSVEFLKSQWPFLFVPRIMCKHFETLTDINILRKLEAALEEYGKVVMEFFRQNPTNNEVKAVLTRSKSSVAAPYVVQVLLAHFKEQTETLILQADVSATAADTERSLTLPGSPRLIVLGPMAQATCWMISIESHVVTEGESFTLGLATLFSSFYNFNLQYQDEACCTLEFIQRWFIGINPERGSKAHQGKVTSKRTGKMVQKKRVPLNHHVCTLMRKLMDFQWDFI